MPKARMYTRTWTFAEIEQMQRWAVDRDAPKKKAGIKPIDWGTRGTLRKNFEGICAERAVADWFGLPFIHRNLGTKGDGRVNGDFRLPNGQTLEVKYRSKVGQLFGLRGKDLSEFSYSYGVLVWPAPKLGVDAVQASAYCTREDFYLNAVLQDQGYGPHYFMPLEKMLPLEQLVDWCHGLHQDARRKAIQNQPWPDKPPPPSPWPGDSRALKLMQIPLAPPPTRYEPPTRNGPCVGCGRNLDGYICFHCGKAWCLRCGNDTGSKYVVVCASCHAEVFSDNTAVGTYHEFIEGIGDAIYS